MAKHISKNIHRILISDPISLVVIHRSILKKGDYADKCNDDIEKVGPIVYIKERMSYICIWVSSCSSTDKNHLEV